MDLWTRISTYRQADEARAAGQYPYFRPLDRPEGTTAVLEGRPVVVMGSNNYLGLTVHPRVRRAAAEALDRFGPSCTGSRFLNGSLTLHRDLETALAAFLGLEDVQTFTTGYQANVGTVSALAGPGDHVVLDREAHASLVDGALLAAGRGAGLHRFRHNSPAHLEAVLARLPRPVSALVAVDGVYSMGGDLAPIPDLLAVCRKFGARLLVDEAHSLGVFGPGGRGAAAHFGLEAEVDVLTGTFSKSLASVGGWAAGRRPVVDYLRHHARALVFSASLPPPSAAAALEALAVLQDEADLVPRLWRNIELYRRGLQALGLPVPEGASPIVPLATGSQGATLAAWQGLLDRGVYTNPVLAPAVPPEGGLLRTSVMASHTPDQLEAVLGAVGATLGAFTTPGGGTRG